MSLSLCTASGDGGTCAAKVLLVVFFKLGPYFFSLNIQGSAKRLQTCSDWNSRSLIKKLSVSFYVSKEDFVVTRLLHYSPIVSDERSGLIVKCVLTHSIGFHVINV